MSEKILWSSACTTSIKKSGSLNNDDGDGQENSKKAIGLYLPNNNFESASRFLVLFFAVVARLQSETA